MFHFLIKKSYFLDKISNVFSPKHGKPKFLFTNFYFILFIHKTVFVWESEREEKGVRLLRKKLEGLRGREEAQIRLVCPAGHSSSSERPCK
jgi:hypothetical protein